ncbi:MAG: HAMP domain-containing protein [Candidatus Riflebacteria bacterium]|nr:HAMP domain-containing protein [Candidatus Riflebacteria bacterium]
MVDSFFFGQTLGDAAREKLETGSSALLDKIFAAKQVSESELKITLYDKNWWVHWGDPPRFPQGGFPTKMLPGDSIQMPGMEGETTSEIFFAVSHGQECLGSIGIGIPESYSKMALSYIHQISLFSFIVIIVGIMLALLISQNILHPLSQIVDGIQSIREGDFSKRVEVNGEDELASMGEMFNLMVSSLQEKIREGRERNRILDEKVQELWEIYELTKAMGFSLNLGAIPETFLEKAQTLSFSSFGMILLCQENSIRVETEVFKNQIPEIEKFDFSEHFQKCLKSAVTLEVKIPSHVILLVPLLSGRKVQGILFLAKVGVQSYSDGVRRFLDTIAPLGGSLIDNARLYQHVVEMKDYIRNVLNSVDSGVAPIDKNGRLETVNLAFKSILRLDDLDAFHQQVEDVFADIPDRNFSKGLLAYLNTRRTQIEKEDPFDEQTSRKELALHFSEKDVSVVQVRVNPLKADDSVIGAVLILDDITSFKKMERHLFDVEKWVSLGRLAASIAHEIRNPLVAISSLVEMIGEEAVGEQGTHVKVILGEVRRLNNFVEQLLNISRPERTITRKTNLIELLKELLLLIRHEAGRQRVLIKEDWKDQEIFVCIDPEKMKQAFLNVAINGIQAMPKGGQLNLSVSYIAPTSSTENKREVRISFEDEGTGIPLEHLAKLFDPFFTTKPHGTGLGLAVTKRIVDLHNGRIDIEPGKNGGTNFSIILTEYQPYGD